MKKTPGQQLHLRIRKQSKEFVDCDYLDKLSEAELLWMQSFVKQHYCSTPDQDASLEEKRALYQTDNERRRDIWNNFQRLSIGDVADE